MASEPEGAGARRRVNRQIPLQLVSCEPVMAAHLADLPPAGLRPTSSGPLSGVP
jgi:hypothetical protein